MTRYISISGEREEKEGEKEECQAEGTGMEEFSTVVSAPLRTFIAKVTRTYGCTRVIDIKSPRRKERDRREPVLNVGSPTRMGYMKCITGST